LVDGRLAANLFST